ncbi:MAG TPA: rRNA maturation RNase YbeY [Gemmatimonadaceae bacterium]|nr:rRNA maturation RNase YbeY [Gemmatimonadaceae bacterium]
MRTTSEHEPLVDVDAQGRRLALGTARVRALASLVLRRERVPHALLSIAFVSRRHIARLNRDHLGHRGETDVITFALDRPGPRAPLVGDIYIAPEVVRGQARRHHVPAREELARVVVHGVLHAVGHDHPDGDTRTASPMWTRQERYLALARRRGVL